MARSGTTRKSHSQQWSFGGRMLGLTGQWWYISQNQIHLLFRIHIHSIPTFVQVLNEAFKNIFRWNWLLHYKPREIKLGFICAGQYVGSFAYEQTTILKEHVLCVPVLHYQN